MLYAVCLYYILGRLGYWCDRIISWKVASLHKDIWEINLYISYTSENKMQWISAQLPLI